MRFFFLSTINLCPNQSNWNNLYIYYEYYIPIPYPAFAKTIEYQLNRYNKKDRRKKYENLTQKK